jgi:hypothetical protein
MEKGFQKCYEHEAHIIAYLVDSSPSDAVTFSTNPVALLNDCVTYLQEKGDHGLSISKNYDSTTILGKFNGFLVSFMHLS